MSRPSTIDFLKLDKGKPINFPCGSCNQEVKHNDKAIFCSNCPHWIHIKCNGISIDEYKFRIKRNRDDPELIENENWICLYCTVKDRSDVPIWNYK